MKKAYVALIVIFVGYLAIMFFLFYGKEEENYQQKKEKEIKESYFSVKKDEVPENVVSNNNTGIAEVKRQLELSNIEGYDGSVSPLYGVQSLSESNLNYLKQNFIGYDLDNLTINQKVILDFDSDGEKEQLIIASNLNDDTSQKKFSVVYYIDKKINTVIKKRFTLDSDSVLAYELVNIVDFNNDGLYEILLQVSTVDTKYECYNLYELEKGNFKPVLLCSYGTTT